MKLTSLVTDLCNSFRVTKLVTALTGNGSAIDAIVPTAGGSAYGAAPTVVITGGGGSGASGTAVLTSQAVTSVTVVGGTGFTSAPTISFTPVSGGSGVTAVATLIPLSLDAVPTVSRAVGGTVAITVGGVVSFYQLTAGTTAQALPDIVRPLDYNGSTNQKFWTLLGVAEATSTKPTTTLTYAATTTVDFNAGAVQSVALTGNVTLASANLGDGKEVTLRITGGAGWTLAFPGGWVFAGAAAPGSIAASKTALLRLRAFGAADANVVAEYIVQP